MNVGEIITLFLVHISFICSIVLMTVVYRKGHHSFLQLAFCALAFIMFVWNLGTMLELDYRIITGNTTNSVVSMMMINLCYLAICFDPIAILFVGLALYKPNWRLQLKHGLLFIIPVISFMMVCTNSIHHLFFQHFSLYSSEAVYGPYYYFHSLYSYGCILLGLGYIALFTYRNSGMLSKQSLFVLGSILIPLTGNVLFSFDLADLPFSVNACLSTVSMLFMFVAIYRYHFITVTPINMRQVVDLISDGFLQTNDKMQIVDNNNMLLTLFPKANLTTESTTISDFFDQIGFSDQKKECFDLYHQTIANKVSATIEISQPDGQSFTMKITPFFEEDKFTGSIVIFKNVSDTKLATELKLKHTLEEFEKSNRDLNERIEESLAQLEEEKQARQSLYDSNPHVNAIIDMNNNVIDCNPAALKLYGFENKADLKAGLMEKVSAAVLTKMPDGEPSIPISQHIRDVIALGETSFDTILLLNGEEIPFHFELKVIPYMGSKVIAIYQTDLRELRRIEKDLERRDMLLTAVNKVASRLISVEDEDFEKSFGESIAMLGRSIDVERVVVWKNFEQDGALYCTQIHEWCEGAQLQHGKPHTINIRYSETVPTWESTLRRGKCVNEISKNLLPNERAQMERQGIVSVLAVPLFVRDIFWGFVGFDDCVNERVFSEMEEKTLGSGAMLIAAALFRNEITSSLILAKEDALSSARAKGAFLANMSHEIRTPLNAIVGMAHIAKRKTTNPEAEGPIDEILRASKHLMDLINDILDFSKIESGKMELVNEAFDLPAAMQEVNALIRPRCVERSIAFETNPDDLPKVAVCGDKLRIKQVLINLLGNAVKFTAEHGIIRFMIDIVAQSASDITLTFSVRDNGIGISPDQLCNLFTAFEQGDPSISIKYKGTGLGLAISQSLVKTMGGEITVDSAINQGSLFQFTLKLPTADLQTPAEDVKAPVQNLQLNGKRILLAEDIEINRVILIELLSDTGIEIDVATDGLEALQVFERSPLNTYDLVFMDIQMPNMNGYQSTVAIRKLDRPDAKVVPIIAMTANAYREDIERALESGMNGHVAKPIDINAIRQLLQERLTDK